jgi:hypothetical protein
MSYELTLVLFCVLMYGMLAGTLLTLCVRRFVNPRPGKRRAPEDQC